MTPMAQTQQVPVKPRLNPNPFERDPRAGYCRIQDVRAATDHSDSVSFQVEYFIPPSATEAFFITAAVPDSLRPSPSFVCDPAGALPTGVPKGEIRFTDNVVFSLTYVGDGPVTTSTIEVILSDESQRALCSRTISWTKTWSPPARGDDKTTEKSVAPADVPGKPRAEIRGLKAASETPGRVRFQVRYWLDPSYPRPCFISAAVPDFAAPLAVITATPAGTPDGVPRGHQTYEDNVAFELTYAGTGPLSTSTLEIRISDKDGKVLASSIQKWSHDWAARVGGPKETPPFGGDDS